MQVIKNIPVVCPEIRRYYIMIQNQLQVAKVLQKSSGQKTIAVLP